MNPFEQFSNVIPFAIFKVSLVVRTADQSEALFEMSYLYTLDWEDQMVCSPALYSENTISVPVFIT